MLCGGRGTGLIDGGWKKFSSPAIKSYFSALEGHGWVFLLKCWKIGWIYIKMLHFSSNPVSLSPSRVKLQKILLLRATLQNSSALHPAAPTYAWTAGLYHKKKSPLDSDSVWIKWLTDFFQIISLSLPSDLFLFVWLTYLDMYWDHAYLLPETVFIVAEQLSSCTVLCFALAEI